MGYFCMWLSRCLKAALVIHNCLLGIHGVALHSSTDVEILHLSSSSIFIHHPARIRSCWILPLECTKDHPVVSTILPHHSWPCSNYTIIWGGLVVSSRLPPLLEEGDDHGTTTSSSDATKFLLTYRNQHQRWSFPIRTHRLKYRRPQHMQWPRKTLLPNPLLK